MTTINDNRDLAVRFLIGLLDEDRVQTGDVLASAAADPRVHQGLVLGLSHLALELLIHLTDDEPRDVLRRLLLASAARSASEGPHDA